MSTSHTNDAPEGASGSASPSPDTTSPSRDNDPTVTTKAEKQAEEHTSEQKSEDSTPQQEEGEQEEGETRESDAPPLPDEVPPPLPNEAPPGEDDGWEPVWDANAQAYYFYNRYTGVSQWENPRVPDAAVATAAAPPAVGTEEPAPAEKASAPLGGYNPAIHGDYDPTAPYAQQYERQEEGIHGGAGMGLVNTAGYEAIGSFNRFTGRWQAASLNPEYHNDENKSRRQMNAYFDVDAAANAHDGRSLRAERSAKKLSKKELKMFKDKRREKKEEKRRAWLRD
ncbi:hypothetical protein AN8804.2 [Aspergillus nidulans FGSC A4]|uniref:WW domain protein (AFU_orthologue AFUA_5G09570) n=1 Tax=Emericella nidulans (strain FGSC A4 / ATCC 38163 / CBS 112.46 / NRRL 194 / M139) TaxID=227321 RepID=Q5ASC6_EMENI|nr:hypothetical protein [Aspergillus nidulans FGSC A4]EAA60597.1 hypothetical protein AN8804.2 [Aspergillus nidulans FGSC A4]CBF77988.1 TPA: WW domain protein (AFU_orthologue; AFUA_5G09570) [Aspergillus nidulans FGSC A4]|eukprot:XP_682073.1 hypothetical protein AN8804.2 [Aspergillus nidulans FGSC A4]